MRRFPAVVVVLVLIGFLPHLHAQDAPDPGEAPQEPQAPDEREEGEEPRGEVAGEDDWGFVPIPIVGRSPDTGWLLGASGFLYWQPQSNETSSDNNTASLALMYGTRGVYQAPFNVTFNLADGRYKSDWNFYIGRSPSDFFGIGPDADSDDAEVYTTFRFTGETAFLFRLTPGLYAGPIAFWNYRDTLESEDDGLLDTEEPTGYAEDRSGGGGAKLVWDTREPQLYPFSGRRLSFAATGSPEALSTTEGFSRFSLDYRHYYSPWDDHVLALQGIARAAVGDPPFTALPALGGQNELRGYAEGRYRDDVSVQGQLEYRFPIWWRFGGVLFGAAGQVAPAFDELSFSKPPAAGGVGLRFTLDTRQNLNLRFDFALSREGTSFYISFREAF
ncbi:MAG: BamA/TamA family outer membrane protein [Spirochaetota bacterium]